MTQKREPGFPDVSHEDFENGVLKNSKLEKHFADERKQLLYGEVEVVQSEEATAENNQPLGGITNGTLINDAGKVIVPAKEDTAKSD